MKLSWKIFFSTLLITILTFGIGGYILISSVFRSSLNREINAALEENKMLYSYLGAIMQNTSSEIQSKGTIFSISESVISYFGNNKLAIRISDEEQNIISQSEDISNDRELLKQLEDNFLVYKTIKNSDGHYIQTASSIQTPKGTVYMETFHNISSVFTERENLFSFYRILMLCMLTINGFLVFLMTFWTLSPLKKLSNTTREIAKGKYGDRAIIQTKDEIGFLAEDFNKMADSLENKIRDLEETTVSQRDFISSFAHEIKTPLTSIIGYADMLR